MTYWNIIVVACFFILYLGLTLVFGQVRALREEIARLGREMATREPVENDENPALELNRRLQLLGTELLDAMDKLPKAFRDDLNAIQGEINQLHRSMGTLNMGMGGGRSGGDGDDAAKSNTYREARLLLANNVDEERVIQETGLTVEEVSLLKRIANKPS
ncbi:MAG: hypothetical protein HQL76_04930 [Magnetococcales bacterium]|nr:hypothetical protein [Magnetococcales bacterium]